MKTGGAICYRVYIKCTLQGLPGPPTVKTKEFSIVQNPWCISSLYMTKNIRSQALTLPYETPSTHEILTVPWSAIKIGEIGTTDLGTCPITGYELYAWDLNEGWPPSESDYSQYLHNIEACPGPDEKN